jgi:phage shock protein PspC (stress-responsive transcriptional regulator)
MTTMSEPSSAQQAPHPPRQLRRSRGDRIVSGVAGGLGEYFGVDAVIFRVLFAVLSFFGGVGLLAYAIGWLLLPEPGDGDSLLDRALHQLRLRRVPPWLVIAGGALLLWICWFSWWVPGPTFPAFVLLAVLAIVLVHRMGNQPGASQPGASQPGTDRPGTKQPASTGPDLTKHETTPALWPDTASGDTAMIENTEPVSDDSASAASESDFAWQPPTATVPLIAPLNDTRRSMQAWIAEASEAHRERVKRRRPIKVGVGLALVAGWAVVALLDAFTRVPFPAYLWVGLIILGAGLLISLVTRRMVLSLLVPMAVLGMIAVALGGTRASLSDGSGQIGWLPADASQLTDHRQFAGQSTLDLTSLAKLTAPTTVRITQAAGEVRLRIPSSVNATVISDVHMGDIQNGSSSQTGQHVSGLNVHQEFAAPSGATGSPLTIIVHLTVGHVQVDRVG